MTYSYYSSGTMIYCKDKSLKELFENISANEIGERDKYLTSNDNLKKSNSVCN